jgi:hypothetical protein
LLSSSGARANVNVEKGGSMKPCTAHDRVQSNPSPKHDVYASITATIVAALEDGVRPWVRPWNAEHAAGPITRPLRHNGQPYTGINMLSLWASARVQGFIAPIWMTYRQAVELGAHVRKSEKGSHVVYANRITRTETDTDSSADVARDIHFLKGYTVFNVEQIDGLPPQYTAAVSPRIDVPARIARCSPSRFATGSRDNLGCRTLAHRSDDGYAYDGRGRLRQRDGRCDGRNGITDWPPPLRQPPRHHRQLTGAARRTPMTCCGPDSSYSSSPAMACSGSPAAQARCWSASTSRNWLPMDSR